MIEKKKNLPPFLIYSQELSERYTQISNKKNN